MSVRGALGGRRRHAQHAVPPRHGVRAAQLSALDPWRLIPWLARRGLLPAGGVRGAIEVHPRAGRHVVLVMTGPGGGLVVKQGLGTEGRACLERETAAYRHLADGAPPVPRLLHSEAGILVLELLELPELGAGSGTAEWAALGSALAALHRRKPPGLPPLSPWTHDLERPGPGLLRVASGAQLELVRRVQRSAVWRGIMADRRRGRARPAFVHGDVRPSNVRTDGRTAVLIDWELAGPGDPAMDAGWALAEIARTWSPPEARRRAHAFWERYAAGSRPGTARRRARRAVGWAALRCLQAAWEMGRERERLPAPARRCLRLGAALVSDPRLWLGPGFGSPNAARPGERWPESGADPPHPAVPGPAAGKT